ncbi:MAG TPA: M67 family metallopeptidase [Gemmatimonadales bacterium]|nr:M67 family metallopeptidase [Gemmatimonadales bacterium]
MTLRLSGGLLEELRREAEQAYPAECCGVLAGRGSVTKDVTRLVPVTNRRTDDPHRYLISPDDLRRITDDLHQEELEILGFYHSHPDHPAAPSAYDIEHAWPWYSYLIVRVSGGRAAELASWQLNDDRAAMRPEPLDVFSEV